jgi:hypothetical protein
MAVTLKQTENPPASWPFVSRLSEAALAVPQFALWSRIEAWCSHRWGARPVVWVVEGPGAWEPPLTPAAVSATEKWDGAAWVADSPPDSPYGGYDLPSEGPWRVTAIVGDTVVPEAVAEAFRRLAEYVSDGMTLGLRDGHSGARSVSYSVGELTESFTRDPNWMARAMINSGAGDLLRPYRRAK